MNKRIFSVCGAAMFLSLLVSSAFGYEKEIEQLSAQMAQKIAGKGKKTVAVVDFTDLEGNVTQLDKFIAEEFSVALAGAGKGLRVIDRTHLKSIIKENKLSATGLIDPATASKLGKIAGVDALVTGTLTPFGDNMRLTVKVLDSETADIIDSAKSNFAKTQAINDLIGKEVSPVTPPPPPAKSTFIVEKEGVIFELLRCRANAARVTCSLLITNNGEDRDFTIGTTIISETKMFAYGNEYPLSEIRLNNKISTSHIRIRFIQEAKIEVDVSFDNVPTIYSDEPIQLLEITASINRYFKIPFRKIRLSKK
ncbi:FlgO family outer membrane protein [Candidatus Electronema sp. PJ]|uniref:FlgO family outer membrane protein n=1 Tax=Candidatus Electronema sp. PJ TaxID=3401572 RepID=UPI003AA7AD33